MTNARSKSETLSKTCISYLDEWVKEQVYNRKKEVTTKYMEKGLKVEDDSLDFLGKELGLGMLLKNDKQYSNDFMQGTPDVCLNSLIIDVKNSWNPFTFPLFESDVPNKDYYWQGQVYMNLTGADKFKLVYCLMDAPGDLIEKEANSFCYKEGLIMTESILSEYTKKMTYPDVDNKLKIKVFNIDKNQEDIDKIEERVKECQTYIDSLISAL